MGGLYIEQIVEDEQQDAVVKPVSEENENAPENSDGVAVGDVQ